jgi:hypothetical protein
MNQRIQKLALQAGVTGHFAAGTELATPIPLSPEMEKFAELIVRECYALVDHENKQFIKSQFKDIFGVQQ